MIVYIRHHQGGKQYETMIFIVLLLLLIFYSFLVSKWILRWIFSRKIRLHRVGIHLLVIILPASLSLVHWLNPAGMKDFEKKHRLVSVNGRFSSGPYPTMEDLIKLKAQGYTTIISLLNPVIIPFEPILMAKEEENVKALGLRLISIPMLPWMGQNKAAVTKIRALAHAKSGKYYVHCYLGKDRIRAFLALLNQAQKMGQPIYDEGVKSHIKLLRRHLARGVDYMLSRYLVVGPMPTKLELFKLLVPNIGNPIASLPMKYLISINGSVVEGEVTLQGREASVASQYGVKFLSFPLLAEPYDANAILSVVKKVRKIHSPAYLYDFLMPPKSLLMAGFIATFKTGLPALPKQLFSKPMTHGAAELIQANVLLGPEPTYREYGGYLYIRGVRNIVYIGPPRNDVRRLKRICRFLHLKWFNFSRITSYKLHRLLKSAGGPWYVFGPKANALLHNKH